MNPGVSCQRQQGGVEDGGLLEIFFAISYFCKFLTDFYSQNQCLCFRRSHGPLLRAFCLCFHFKISDSSRTRDRVESLRLESSLAATAQPTGDRN